MDDERQFCRKPTTLFRRSIQYATSSEVNDKEDFVTRSVPFAIFVNGRTISPLE